MKGKAIPLFTIFTMVVTVGLQALLRGSWKVRQTEPVRSDIGRKNRDWF
ncbi:hypothetical protein [Pareuzebyella sediminis]|nr:hypothetical protein [Pareuzebyella sediminis]